MEEYEIKYEQERQRKKCVAEYLALFTLAQLEVLKTWELPDQYSSRLDTAWLLVKTQYGLIKIGWRKRVISIDWEDTGLKLETLTKDEVTKSEFMLHAWSYSKALEYLADLRRALVQNERDKRKENEQG